MPLNVFKQGDVLITPVFLSYSFNYDFLSWCLSDNFLSLGMFWFPPKTLYNYIGFKKKLLIMFSANFMLTLNPCQLLPVMGIQLWDSDKKIQ